MFEDYGLAPTFDAREQSFFKEIIPQKKLNPILVSQFSGMCPWGDIPLSCLLTSKLDVKSDSIIVHYTYKKGFNTDMNIPPKEIKLRLFIF